MKDLFAEKSNGFQPKSQTKKIVATYDYTDENGNLLFQSIRYEPKGFTQRKPMGNGGFDYNLNGTRRVLYRLSEVLTAKMVFIVEGEKDVETLRKQGYVATCNPAGALKWRDEYNEALRDKKVVILPDNDETGRKHALQVANSLYGTAKEILIFDLPNLNPKGDVSDFFQNGGTNDEIISLLDSAEKWQPKNDQQNKIASLKIGYTFGELQKLELPKREEIIRGLGRGENGLLNSVTNVGKTTLIRNVALSLICGRIFSPLSVSNKKFRVLIIDSEDSLSFLRSDINKMIADFSEAEKELIRQNLFFICEFDLQGEDLKLNKPAHFDLIASTISDFKADIVFIDTISKSFSIRNENDNSEIKEFVLKPLHRLAKFTKTAVLASHHFGKAKLEEGQSRENAHKGRGGSSFADLSRIIFNLEKDAVNDSVILSCAKIKGEKFQDTILKHEKEKRWFIKQRENLIQTNYEILMEVFTDGKSYKRSKIEEILDGEIHKSTLTRLLSEAVGRGDLTKQKGFYSINAQMLTPNSDEHLSISDKSNENRQLQDTQISTQNMSEHKFDESEVEYF